MREGELKKELGYSSKRKKFERFSRMKFFNCSQCLGTNEDPIPSGSIEITNPLVITKRPIRLVSEDSKRRISFVTSRTRLPPILRSLSASWKRRKRSHGRTRLESRKSKKRNSIRECKSKEDRGREALSKVVDDVSTTKEILERLDRLEESNRSSRRIEDRDEELEREYYEHFKFLIDPPPCFRNVEANQNLKNKFNSLELKRINTVAIPETTDNTAALAESIGISRTLNFKDTNELGRRRTETNRFFRVETLGLILRESFEVTETTTMEDLLDRNSSILKSQDDGAKRKRSFKRENKTVRFKDEEETLSKVDNFENGVKERLDDFQRNPTRPIEPEEILQRLSRDIEENDSGTDLCDEDLIESLDRLLDVTKFDGKSIYLCDIVKFVLF